MPPPSHPQHPALTPALCLQIDALRSFLRLSRAAIDDPISQHLASMNRPSEQPFDPASFSSARSSAPSRRSVTPQSCAAFVSHTLFPAWATRARVLEYCAGVAGAQERDELAGQQDQHDMSNIRSRSQWGGTLKGGNVAIGANVVGPETGSRERDTHGPTTSSHDLNAPEARQRVVDERLDPYSARDYTDESPGERIARVVREEKTVETIIRTRSWGVVRDRCGSSVDDWEEGMKKWEGEMTRRASQSVQADSSGTRSSQSALTSFWR